MTNPTFILVLAILLQLAFGHFMKALFPGLISVGWFRYIQISVSSILSIFIPSYLFLKQEKKPYFVDCFSKVGFGKLFIFALGIGFFAQFAGMIANLPMNYLLYLRHGELTEKIPDIMSFSSLIFAVLSLCVLPAILEEVLFRGIIFHYFRQYGVKAAILISSTLFAIMHFDLGNLLGTFVLGLIFGVMTAASNRLIYPIIAHFSVNLFATLIKYFSRIEFFKLLYGDLVVIAMILSIPMLIYLLKLFQEQAEPLPYRDQELIEYVGEEVFEIDENNSIKIFEHNIKENNIKMAWGDLFRRPHPYILILLFLFLEGSKIWGK